MTHCPCDDLPQRILRIPAGLSMLPRQLQAFPEVRLALLAEVARNGALDGWRARGERDFGVMWLEMWAYVADVLGFYDERIANESYLRTAVRRPSLRRIIELLGYVPAPGVAGSASIAAIAEGRTAVPVPGSTAFRSDAFGAEAPQVFEADLPTSIHPFTNSWLIGAVPARTLQAPPVSADAPHAARELSTSELLFETAEFGLAKDRLLLITHTTSGSGLGMQVAKVTKVVPVEGKDGRTRIRVLIDREVQLSAIDEVASIRVQTPTVTARITSNLPPRPSGSSERSNRIENLTVGEVIFTRLFLDTIYRQTRIGDPIIAARTAEGVLGVSTIDDAQEVLVSLEEDDAVRLPATRLDLVPALDSAQFVGVVSEEMSFHFAFVDAGRLTRVADTELTEGTLRASGGVPVTGIVERPPAAVTGELNQKFLLRDADNQGALLQGRMTFNADGTARFQVTEDGLPPLMKTPITVFGNVLQVTRGESVFNEILGNGDARVARQSFKLKKKPLTYFFDPSVPGTKARSTLEVRADDVLWREVRSFFGTGPQDRVYIVRHDDDGNTFLTFGDGVRGARLPSGIRNVRATYRFGSGEAAPPAGAIKQLARAVKGLRRVESPIAAIGGKDPDPPKLLRTSAPQSVLIFERAVSTLDFEALANLVPGVIRATAEFAWIETEQEAGVVVTYLGSAQRGDVLAALRQQAEPGLPLVAQPALPKARKFVAEVEVDPRFDKDVVAAAVRAALVDPESGPLATRNAPIGQRLFRSVLFDVIHGVPGVASITSAVVKTLSDVTLWDFRFTGISAFATFPGPCAGAGHFYDFADGERVVVNAILATAPVLGLEARDAR
jgi:hypothetical protein